jgi:HPt (histidine-containing phosphotransfer) domain-containing protein
MDLERQIGRANLAKVIDTVLSEAAQRWDELIVAEAACDVATMERHAHSLGSIFRSAGLIQAGDALAAIETTLRRGEELNAGWLVALEPLKSASLLALTEALRARE